MIVSIRVFGKKELSQLNTADIILIMLVSNAVQNAMVGNDSSLSGGLIAASILFFINLIFKRILANNTRFRNLIEDKPKILIHKGKADFKLLGKLGISSEELFEAMREHGVDRIKDVKLAMFEMDGNISIVTGAGSLKETHYKRKYNRKNLGA